MYKLSCTCTAHVILVLHENISILNIAGIGFQFHSHLPRVCCVIIMFRVHLHVHVHVGNLKHIWKYPY